MSPPARKLVALATLALILAGAIALRLWIGGQGQSPAITAQFLELREGRVLMGLIVGSSLAVAGVMLQSLLRNPLASPDLLGLASGAGLGVMLVAYLGWKAGLGIAAGSSGGALGVTTTSAAVAGSLGALAVVFLLSQRRGLLEPTTLVLVGVVISIMASAGTALVRSLMPDQGAMAASRLLFGELRDIHDVPRFQVWLIGGLAVVGIVIGWLCGRAMDAAALGEDEARSVGVPLGRLRALLFITAGVLAAGSVVLAGPIGFVGLICPHAVRLLAGPSHRTLVVGAALAGGALVVLADAFARAIDFGAGHPPISVLTSLVGGPVLVLLLRRQRA